MISCLTRLPDVYLSVWALAAFWKMEKDHTELRAGVRLEDEELVVLRLSKENGDSQCWGCNIRAEEQAAVFAETCWDTCAGCVQLCKQILTLGSWMNVREAFSSVFVCGQHSTAQGGFNPVLPQLWIAIN